MGEVKAKVIFENLFDRISAKKGLIKETEVKKVEVEALVDTGSRMILMPQDMVEYLGLDIYTKQVVTLADESKKEMAAARPLNVKILGREMSSDCLVNTPKSEVLIGQIVLEELDLLVDCANKTLKVNPESPYLPSCKAK